MQHQSMLGVHFRPGGAFPLLDVPAIEITDKHADLQDLWGRPAMRLWDRLCAAATPRRRFQLMEESLIERRRRPASRHPATAAALQLFGPAGTGASTRDVAREVGLCQRRLIQLFTNQVGLRPKLLCRILRFQCTRAAAEEIQKRGPASMVNWAGLAAACGYYDQSHLIDDFHEFSGLSPAEYLRRLRPAHNLKDNHLPVTA